MLEALFERKSGGDLYQTRLSEVLLGGWRSSSGVPVTWRSALQCVTFLACARVIAEGIAQVPWKLMRDQNGTMETALNESLHGLISLRPNDWMTSFELREMIGLHLAVTRNAFVFLNKVRGDQVAELLPLTPGQVEILKDGFPLGEHQYRVTWANGQQVTVPRANIWHLRGLSWDGIEGLDGVRYAREALGLNIAMEKHSAKLFGSGTRTTGVLQTDQVMSPEKAKEFRDQWQENYAGLENAGVTPILHSGFKWATSAMTSGDAQLIEQRRFQVEQICSAMRVLPIMIGFSDKTATYASAEQMFLAHSVHTLDPWFERVRQSADINLLSEAQRRRGFYTYFNQRALLRGSHADRATYYSKALGAGGSPAWMTPDEVRALEELNPIGGDAGKLPAPTNLPKGNSNGN